MNIMIVVFLTGLIYVNVCSSMKCVLTNDEGPQINKTCVFPFIIGNQSYSNCTNNHDKFGKFWCSTKVNEEGKHVAKEDEWGYCGQGPSFNSHA
jgi:hypothetical protein